jgi:hypothetical protein
VSPIVPVSGPIEALLEQRRTQGFDTPPGTVIEQLARLITLRTEDRQADPPKGHIAVLSGT